MTACELCTPVVLWPKYCWGHPENYLFSSSKKSTIYTLNACNTWRSMKLLKATFTGSFIKSNPKGVDLNLKTKALVESASADVSVRSPEDLPIHWTKNANRMEVSRADLVQFWIEALMQMTTTRWGRQAWLRNLTGAVDSWKQMQTWRFRLIPTPPPISHPNYPRQPLSRNSPSIRGSNCRLQRFTASRETDLPTALLPL